MCIWNHVRGRIPSRRSLEFVWRWRRAAFLPAAINVKSHAAGELARPDVPGVESWKLHRVWGSAGSSLYGGHDAWEDEWDMDNEALKSLDERPYGVHVVWCACRIAFIFAVFMRYNCWERGTLARSKRCVMFEMWGCEFRTAGSGVRAPSAPGMTKTGIR